MLSLLAPQTTNKTYKYTPANSSVMKNRLRIMQKKEIKRCPKRI
jgi:hypothetical protein